jgi:L-amino acid N-acyltransferase YncA
LFIAHLARDVIGTVRFDALDSYPGSWEISIALNPAMRGRSLGGQLLARAEQALREQVAGGLTLVAQVRRDNNPSMRLFQNAGYVVADERNTADLAEWRKSLPN